MLRITKVGTTHAKQRKVDSISIVIFARKFELSRGLARTVAIRSATD